MSDIKPPVGVVLRRTVNRLGDDDAGGLPTAHSRVDIFESRPVIIPALQSPADAVKPTPTFEPVRSRAWLRLYILTALLLGVAVVSLVLWMLGGAR